MRKLVHALLITLGCFSAASVYAQEEEVVISTETTDEGSSSESQFLFQQEEGELAEDEGGKN